MEYIKSVDKTIERSFAPYVKKQNIVKGIIHLLIVLYAARLAPQLPKPVTDLFTNAYFRLFVFSLILWIAQFSPSTSLLIALAFMMTVNYANNKQLWEFMENVEQAIEAQPEQAAQQEEMPLVIEVPVAPAVAPELPLPEITGVAEMEVAPAPAPAPAPAFEEAKPASGCFPERKVDLTNVTGFSSEDQYQMF
jgi:hypothetical protein